MSIIENSRRSTELDSEYFAYLQQQFETLDAFVDEYVIKTPMRQPGRLSHAVNYEHLTYYGALQEGQERNGLIVVRESPEIAVRTSAFAQETISFKTSDLGAGKPADPKPALVDNEGAMLQDRYLVATVKGGQVREWDVKSALWRDMPGTRVASHSIPFKLSRQAVPELVLMLKPRVKSSETATLLLSPFGGVMTASNGEVTGWLVGGGQFERGPHFMTEPAKVPESLLAKAT